MVEVVKRVRNAILSLKTSGSLLRTIIYTLGHLVIAVTCVMLITGAHVHQALADAFIEPVLNSIWFFALDRFWTCFCMESSVKADPSCKNKQQQS